MNNNILVIEDEPNIAETLADILELKGYAVRTASNGVSGFAKAVDQTPDLILCDVMMPEMNGYEVLEALRKHQQTSQVPFIFLTAKGNQEDFRLGMDLGADDYLIKPIQAKKLYQVIESRIKRHHSILEIGQADENNRLSRDLHDTLQQTLLGLKMKLEYVVDRSRSGHKCQKEIEKSLEAVRLALSQLRMILEGREMILQEMGFVAGVERIIHRISKYVDFEIHIENETELDIPEEQSRVLFKILFEILNNVIKHSQASNLNIKLGKRDNLFCIIISDDGCGFDMNQTSEGHGLKNIRKRMEKMGGKVSIDSSIGNGTITKLTFKCENQ